MNESAATMDEDLRRVFQNVQLHAAVSYTLMLLLSGGLLVYLRLARTSAYAGDVQASRNVLLPTFEPLLWTLCVALSLYAGSLWATAALDHVFNPVHATVVCAGRQFIFLLLLAYFYQRSVTAQALARAITIALTLSLLPVVIALLGSVGDPVVCGLQMSVRACISAVDVYMLMNPRSRASVRSLRAFCSYRLVVQLLEYTYEAFFYANMTRYIEVATTLVVVTVHLDSLLPLFAWALLRADTEHWRGLGQRAILLHHALFIPEITSAQGLQLLIEMHRNNIIDFAQLAIHGRIGAGVSAVVYRGKLRTKLDVAIKVYSPTAINDEILAGFSREAALCAALVHPNIVSFYGMCVCPPTICLVFELCRGSVADYLALPSESLQQWVLDICLLLDTARAVAYLHSFSPPFLHRDIKPPNLLLDANGMVKLADFGASRARAGDMAHPSADVDRRMTVQGTADYMAPEVINGKSGLATYTEAIDVFSLGITMWDVLHRGHERYPGTNHSHLRVFERVLLGDRPKVRTDIHPRLAQLLEATWRAEPECRPTAASIVAVLEAVQVEALGPVAFELSRAVTYLQGRGKDHVVEGDHLVTCMLNMEWVRDASEAIRLGTALMDVGFLHHAKHARCFERASSLYFFDADAWTRHVPLVETGRIASATTGSSTATSEVRSEPCSCKLLAQGLKVTKHLQTAATSRLFTLQDEPLSLKLLADDLASSVNSSVWR